jgi:hypothetical protein
MTPVNGKIFVFTNFFFLIYWNIKIQAQLISSSYPEAAQLGKEPKKP